MDVKKIVYAVASALLICPYCAGAKEPSFAKTGKVGICCQCGFWDNEKAWYTQESVASLVQAQKNHFWGSEMDLRMTLDGVVLVYHNQKIGDVVIDRTKYEDLRFMTLKNGEKIPTFEEYLKQTKKSGTTLVVEIKTDPSSDRHKQLISKTVELVKANGLLKPGRIVFLSWQQETCQELTRMCPGIIVELIGNLEPQKVHDLGINGIDYKIDHFRKNPEWIEEAHKLGMLVHVWGINTEKDVREMVGLGVDMITTMNPMMVRQALGKQELKNN